jgi:hypothetical protein
VATLAAGAATVLLGATEHRFERVRVVDWQTKTPVESALVSIDSTFSTHTDSNGLVAVPMVPRVVWFRKAGYFSSTIQADQVDYSHADSASILFMHRGSPTLVRVAVTDTSNGRPVADAKVQTERPIESVFTDSAGVADLSIETSTGWLAVSHDDFLPWQSAQWRHGDTVALAVRLVPAAWAASIRGRVTEKHSRKPVVGANVVTVEREESSMLGAATGNDGTYLVMHVPPGRRTVRVGAVGYQALTETVDISPGQTHRLDFAFSGGRLPTPTRQQAQFGLFRAGLALPSLLCGRGAVRPAKPLARAGRLELGHFAIGVQRQWWPTVTVGCRLFEWFDEGGTRFGQPAILPMYLEVADGPSTNGLLRRLRIRDVGGALREPCFYIYAMGSVSRSIGAGVGARASIRSSLRSALTVVPCLELGWRRSWDGQSRYSTLSLVVGVGLGAQRLPLRVGHL